MKHIPFHKVAINAYAKRNVKKVLASGWLTTGKYAKELEEYYKNKTGAAYAIAVNSATAGLSLALKAIKKFGYNNERVAVPTYTFVSSVNTIEMNGFTPYFIDTELEYPRYDVEEMRNALNNGVRIAMPVSIGGIEIKDSVLRQFDVIIRDLAHRSPSLYDMHAMLEKDNKIQIDVYSLYATKVLSAGEGGMIVTDNKNVYEEIKKYVWHGITKTTLMRRGSLDDEYDIENIGYKFGMSDLHAAVALGQAKTVKKDVEKLKNIFAMYYLEIRKNAAIMIPFEVSDCHLAMLMNKSSFFSRKEMRQRLLDKGIETSVHFKPVHLFSYYAKKYAIRPNDYPRSVRIWNNEISLPIYPSLSRSHVKYIIDTMHNI